MYSYWMSFQILQFGLDQIASPCSLNQSLAFPRTKSNCANLKSAAVLIVGFKVLRESFEELEMAWGHSEHMFLVVLNSSF